MHQTDDCLIICYYCVCPGLQDSSDATASGISQQHIEPSISHRSKRLKFMESSVGKFL